MSCSIVRRGDLDAYVSGELGPAEARPVEAHLFECNECAIELRRIRVEQRLFRARAEQDRPVVPSFDGVLARIDRAPARSGSKLPAPRPPAWTSRLAPAGVAVAALAAAAASWVGVRPSPVDTGPATRQHVEDLDIGPDRMCTGEPPVSDELRTSEPPPVPAIARSEEENSVCGTSEAPGATCGVASGSAAEACDDSVAWCSALKP